MAKIPEPLVDSVVRGLESTGALLYGPTGLGKTFAMVAAMKETPSVAHGGVLRGPMFVDWPEFIGDIRRFETIETPDRERFDPLRRLSTYPGPMFVDDVGQEQAIVSGFRQGEAETVFSEFVNRRTGMQLALWIATNLAPKEIGSRYGQRTISRLAEHCVFVKFAGADRRIVA
jgi:DNA replication protein DnaC